MPLLKSMPTVWLGLIGLCLWLNPGLASAQFPFQPRRAGQRGFFDSDEFDSRSRERNSLEHDSDEFFLTGANNGATFNQNFNLGQTRSNNLNTNNFRNQNNNNFNRNNVNFRSSSNIGETRFRDSDENDSFEINLLSRNRLSQNNRGSLRSGAGNSNFNRGNGGFSRESRESIEVTFFGRTQNNNNIRNFQNQQPQSQLRNGRFRLDSPEDISFERFVPIANSNQNRLNVGNRQANANHNKRFNGGNRQASVRPNIIFGRDSIEDDSVEVSIIPSTNTQFTNIRNNLRTNNRPNNNFRPTNSRRSSEEFDRIEVSLNRFNNVNSRVQNVNNNRVGNNLNNVNRPSTSGLQLGNRLNANVNRHPSFLGNNHFRIDNSIEDNSIEIKLLPPVTNTIGSSRPGRAQGFNTIGNNLNQRGNNIGNLGFRRGSFEDVSVELQLSQIGNDQVQNVNNKLPVNVPSTIFGNIGFRKDSNELDNSLELVLRPNIGQNTRQNIRQNARQNTRQNTQQENNSNALLAAFGVSNNRQNQPGSFNFNVPFRGTSNQANNRANQQNRINQNRVRTPTAPRATFFDSIEDISFERQSHEDLRDSPEDFHNSPEDLIEDLFDDSREDRRRAQQALQRLAGQGPQSNTGSFTSSSPGNPFSTFTSRRNHGGGFKPSTNPILNKVVSTGARNGNSNTNQQVVSNRNKQSTPKKTKTQNRTNNRQFPTLPSQSFRAPHQKQNTFNSHVIRPNNQFNGNRNTKQQAIFGNQKLNVNPFLSNVQANKQQNQIRHTTQKPHSTFSPPRKSTIHTPKPVRHHSKPNTLPTPRPKTGSTPRRPTSHNTHSQNRNSVHRSNGSNQAVNPFVTAARLNNKPQNKPRNQFTQNTIFTGFRSQPKKTTKKPIKKNNSSKSKKPDKPRKSIPVRVPDGFNWPGGNGYYFRMSTGNSKPVQYFISYDN